MPPFEQRKVYDDYAYNFDRQRQASPAWVGAQNVTTALQVMVSKTDSRKTRLLEIFANNMSFERADVGVYDGSSLLFSVQVPASSTLMLQSSDKFGLADLSPGTTLQVKGSTAPLPTLAPLTVRLKFVVLQL